MNRFLRILPALVVVALAFAPARDEAPVSSRVAALLAADDPGATRVWVYLQERSHDRTVDLTPRARRRLVRRTGAAGVGACDHRVSGETVHAIAATGAVVRCVSRYLNAVSALATAREIAAIRRLDGVARVTRVATYRRPLPADLPTGDRIGPRASAAPCVAAVADYGASRRQVEQIGVIPLHDDGYHGEGVLVAVLDSGFERAHESLSGVDVVAEWDFIFDDSVTSDEPQDSLAPSFNPQELHGTNVLSTIAGHADGTLIGPAWGASFLLAKTERIWEEVTVEEDDFVRALEWADSIGADVVTASLGYYEWYDYADMNGNTAVTTVACDIAASRGITVVVSAGNEGSGVLGWPGILAPADGDSVIAVGAVDSTGVVVGFSSRGPTFDGRIKPDVMAMGRDVLVASSYDSLSYYRRNGTSFAAPLVAGACALLLQVHPTWGPSDVLAALRAEASNAASPDNVYGWGVIDAAQSAQSGATGVLSGVTVSLQRSGADVVVTMTQGASGVLTVDLERRARSSASDWTPGVTVETSITLSPGAPRSIRDSHLEPGVYEYRVRVSSQPSQVSPWRRVEVPFALALAQSAPNPFEPAAGVEVTIAFTVGEGSYPYAAPGASRERVELSIYDVRGARVRTLFQRLLGTGDYESRWDGRDDRGVDVASGVYFYRLQVGTRALTRKLVVVRP